MMKKSILIVLAMWLSISTMAQRYSFTFELSEPSDSIMYIGRHFRDQLQLMDTAKVIDGKCVFNGNQKWERGVYALVDQSGKKSYIDFVIDKSHQFTITLNNAHRAIKVKGCESNQKMYAYINRIMDARTEMEALQKQLQSGDKASAQKRIDELNKEMAQFESQQLAENQKYLFFQLLKQFIGPNVPEEEPNKAYYFRMHYWDDVDLTDHSLIYTPDLFNKMNYYFYGMLFNSETDTICKYADRVLERIEDDPVMLQYMLDFIVPRYYQSTTKIGWDATWCHLIRKYYLSGKCTWASNGEINSKRQTLAFIEKSIIGAHGTEIWMADTNQSPNPKDWISSHRLPYKYVILWFWDPDCNHCQTQTADLIKLYNEQTAAGTRNFEIYAIGYESDVDKWKNYVKKHHLPWINVGGPNVNVDYQEEYNVHGSPTMIILNEQRDIIMNKNLPATSIIPFLNRYEQKLKNK